MSDKADPLAALLEQASREGHLGGASLEAFAAALRERAAIVIEERLRSVEEELAWRKGEMESLKQEVAWRRESLENLLSELEGLASRPALRSLRLRRDLRQLLSRWPKEHA